MALLKKQAATQDEEFSDKQEDLVATLHTSFFLLLFLLLSSILVSLCELVVFSWQNKGRQTAWTALLAQIKSVAARSRKKDELDLEEPEADMIESGEPFIKAASLDEEEERSSPDQKLIKHQAEGKENTRL